MYGSEKETTVLEDAVCVYSAMHAIASYQIKQL